MNENNKNKHKSNNKNIGGDPNKNPRKRIVTRIFLFVLTLIVVSTIIMPAISPVDEAKNTIKSYNEFMGFVNSDAVESVDYDPTCSYILFKLKDSDVVYQTDNPKVNTFKLEMLKNNVTVNEVNLDENMATNILWSLAQTALTSVIMIGVFAVGFVFISGKVQNVIQGGGLGSKPEVPVVSTTTFDDVAGLEEVKESLHTVVDMLKDPQKYKDAGAELKKGAILIGPTGTGKTLLARAIAGETASAGVKFIQKHGAEFDNKYVGVGADAVRSLFEQAEKHAPCIIFIDEIDAIGRRRSDADRAHECQTLEQLLTCMDGFKKKDGIYVIAATNHYEVLDDALKRPGRFDDTFVVGIPKTAKERLEIIKLYAKNKKLDESVSLEAFAKKMLGHSPAEIKAILNEAAIESVKNGGIITKENIDEAYRVQQMKGHRVKHSDRSESDTKITAYHEVGHALVGLILGEDVTEVSIVPVTSGAEGVTYFAYDKLGMYSKTELENRIKINYAGRNAEFLLNGKDGITTGASQDIKNATSIIRHMIFNCGMSNFGLLDLENMNVDNAVVFAEYQRISSEMENESMKILVENQDILEAMSAILIEKETIAGDELRNIFNDLKNKRRVTNEQV